MLKVNQKISHKSSIHLTITSTPPYHQWTVFDLADVAL